MASPQKEHGFTPIANEILEALSRTDLTGCQLRFILLIIRESYGWGRKHADLSYSDIGHKLRMARSNVARIVRELRGGVIMHVEPSSGISQDNTPRNRFVFRKDYHQWGVIKKRGVIQNDNTKQSGNDNTPPSDIVESSPSSAVKKKEKRKPPVAGATSPQNGIATPSFLLPPGQVASVIPNLVEQVVGMKAGRSRRKVVVSISDEARKLLHAYKTLQEDRTPIERWDAIYFKRFADDVEDFVEVFAGDYRLAALCLADLATEFRAKELSWTWNTIIRHAGEWKFKHAPKDPA